MKYLMLSLLITFSTFAYSYDKDLAKLNNIIKVSHTLDSYKTDVNDSCADGFIEGVKKEYQYNYDYKECKRVK